MSRCIPCEIAEKVRKDVQAADAAARAYLRTSTTYTTAFVVQNARTDEYTWCLPDDPKLYTEYIVISEILK